MTMPADHTALIRRTGYPVPAGPALDPHDQRLLARYGYWLEGLATGAIAPVTPEQEQFVRVAGGDADPESAFEIAWVKGRQLAGPAPAPVGPLELADRLARLADARAVAAAARTEYDRRRAAILERVRPELDALDAEFADRLESTGDKATRLESEARTAVLAHGASFRHGGVHAVYTRGRVTWDGKGLSRYAETHADVGEFRRVGPPSVALRFTPGGRPAVEGVDGDA